MAMATKYTGKDRNKFLVEDRLKINELQIKIGFL